MIVSSSRKSKLLYQTYPQSLQLLALYIPPLTALNTIERDYTAKTRPRAYGTAGTRITYLMIVDKYLA